ncbi:permease [Streptomyces eurocidicus]|uniref:Permease n=1 Tax=Streptomyces eurocidicus TaxID=66423 RepID=A0A2N8P3H3_STREU|nr:ABC transporter permease [Streptomyces eurocidicus]MBB5117778.1 osmoprotectant transport system permease protein [Streptomyces eurocidicus]MBF6053612.1 ABC transporter permease subunit [Streptomyces eurocidicus]PNE35565.1 permease [Streptomyces eurocidicus]
MTRHGDGRRPAGEHEVRGIAFSDPGEAVEPEPPEEPGPPAGEPAGPRRITWQRLVVLPAVVAAVLLATWLWFRGAELDSIAENSLAGGNVWLRLRQHISLTVVSTFFVLIIAIPLGVLLTRRRLRPAAPLVMALANIGQATPAIGLLALLVIWLGIGTRAALIGIVVYAVLPVLANTVAGLRAIDPTLVEAARGIGMSAAGVLRKVELPLAVPLILAGVRTALVLNVGTATLAYFGGGGGLGDLIASGITNQRMPVLVLGSVLTVALALLVDWLASLAEVLLRPRGLDPAGPGGARDGGA